MFVNTNALQFTVITVLQYLSFLCPWSSDMPSSNVLQLPTLILAQASIGLFTVVCLVTWPFIGSEAGGEMQTSLLFICKSKLVSIRTA